MNKDNYKKCEKDFTEIIDEHDKKKLNIKEIFKLYPKYVIKYNRIIIKNKQVIS